MDCSQGAKITQLNIRYYRRARMLNLSVADADGNLISSETDFPLSALIRSAQIPRDEMLQSLDEAEAPIASPKRLDAEYNEDFDRIREWGIRSLGDLRGKTVLDIGGYSGEFARLALDWGASQATVYDSGEYMDYGWAKPVMQSGVSFQRGNLMDFGWRAPAPADFTIFYNVIYHMRDPWSALERVKLLTKERMAICTSFLPGDIEAWGLFGHDDPNERPINDTYTVFWRPTIPGLLKLMRLVGFRDFSEFRTAGDHVVLTAGV